MSESESESELESEAERGTRPRSTLIAAIVVLALGAGAVAIGVTQDRGPFAGTSPPGPKPNIVFILTDDQTYESVQDQSLGVMPYLNGRKDWIRFTNAFQEVSLCCPSRASILSGELSSHTSVENNTSGHEFDESSTIATWLKADGYQTSLVGKYLNSYPFGRPDYVPPGWDDWHVFSGDDEEAHPVGYFDYKLNDNGTINSYGHDDSDYATDVESGQAVDFINRTNGPFFLMVAPKAPHSPWEPPTRYISTSFDVHHSPNYNEADVSDKPDWVKALPLIDTALTDKHRVHAYRTLRAVDDLVKNVFDALDTKGVLNNTIIVFMTDNGFAFGEHRWDTKRCPYDECMRSPMLVRYPGQQGRTVDALVQNIDMASTFAAIAGATPAIAQDGVNLVPLFTGQETSVHDALLFRWQGGNASGEGKLGTNGYIPEYWGIRDPTHAYLEYADGEKELYDLTADPYELTNLASDPAHAAEEADLHARLAVLEAQATAPS